MSLLIDTSLRYAEDSFGETELPGYALSVAIWLLLVLVAVLQKHVQTSLTVPSATQLYRSVAEVIGFAPEVTGLAPEELIHAE